MPEDNSKEKDRIVRFRKSTESEVAYAAQAFFESFTPLWFNWLGWVLATGGLTYLSEITGSTTLKVLSEISFLLISFYFLYFFASIRIEPYDSWWRKQPSKSKRFFCMLPGLFLSIALWVGTRMLVISIIEQVRLTKS